MVGALVSFVIAVTDPFVEPFRGMFALDRVRADQGSVFDVAALVALVGWTLIEALVLAALRIFARRPKTGRFRQSMPLKRSVFLMNSKGSASCHGSWNNKVVNKMSVAT